LPPSHFKARPYNARNLILGRGSAPEPAGEAHNTPPVPTTRILGF